MAGRKTIAITVLLMVGSMVAFAQKGPYTEDLTRLRPEFPPVSVATPKPPVERIPATEAVNTRLNAALTKVDEYYLEKMLADGFRIQVYSGQKKQDALQAARVIQDAADDLKPEVEFVQPKFRVVVGKYFSRVEAQQDMYRLLKLFPESIIVPDKVSLGK